MTGNIGIHGNKANETADTIVCKNNIKLGLNLEWAEKGETKADMYGV